MEVRRRDPLDPFLVMALPPPPTQHRGDAVLRLVYHVVLGDGATLTACERPSGRSLRDGKPAATWKRHYRRVASPPFDATLCVACRFACSRLGVTWWPS